MKTWNSLDPDELPSDQQTCGKVNIQLGDMDLPSWEHDLNADLDVIECLLGEMEKVSPADDAKLQHLKEQILGKIERPSIPATVRCSSSPPSQTPPITCTSISPPVLQNATASTPLASSVRTGPSPRLAGRLEFQELLMLFSPQSKEKALLLPEVQDEIDLLIATDCISEGQNLQDCDYLINYDIHWNPVRIIQRFGRIDRIGSKNASIQLVNYWPDISLDEYIRLKERVESRMVIADVTATGDENPLDGRSNDLAYRKEQLRRMQEEVIELEDLKAGVSITDLGLNDFRMDLLNYVKTNGDLSRLPSGMHAVLPAAPERGLVPGVIFALRNRNESVNVSQLNRLHPYYLVYVDMEGETVLPHTEVKRLLTSIRSVAKPCETPIPEAYQPFNLSAPRMAARCGVYSDLLTAAIRSIVQVNEEKDLDSLFSGQKTTALTGPGHRPRRLRTDRVSCCRGELASGGCRPMFLYPEQAQAQTASSPRTRSTATRQAQPGHAPAFCHGVDQIVWRYELAHGNPRSCQPNRASRRFRSSRSLSRPENFREDVLRTIDRAIPSLIFFELTFQGQVRFAAAYKRPPVSAAGESIADQPVVEAYFETPWQSSTAPRLPLPVAVDLGGLYEQMLRQHMLASPLGCAPAPVSPLHRPSSAAVQIRALRRECQRSETMLRKEIQFNRKVEINRELRRSQEELLTLERKSHPGAKMEDGG